MSFLTFPFYRYSKNLPYVHYLGYPKINVVIMDNTENDLQCNVDLWIKELENKISITKTKMLVISNYKEEKISLRINSQIIKQVESIKYLGTVIDNTGILRRD